jgi:hypothetical protein
MHECMFEIISMTTIPNDAGSPRNQWVMPTAIPFCAGKPGQLFAYARVVVAALAVSHATKLERGCAGRVAIPG